MTRVDQFDAVVVGGGHNGLIAAAYLARAGLRVAVLERLGHVGGAAVSAPAFEGVDARLSRYSYPVSLLPKTITDDLGARIRLARRGRRARRVARWRSNCLGTAPRCGSPATNVRQD